MINYGKHNVLGVRVDAVDYDASVQRIICAAQRRQPLAISALAVHGVITGAMDATQRYRLNRLDLVVPDGQPVRRALKWLHRVPLPDRVYGPTLMLQACARAAELRLPVFLFGGTAALLESLQERLQMRFASLEIAGTLPSRFRQLSAGEREEVVAAIRDSGAAITFVGLGCPRQEVWVFEFRDALSMPLVAVGAAFDFHAGNVPQAPHFLQKRGLEWSYRLVHEPRRLWKRYLLLNPLYLILLGLQWTGLRTVDPDLARPPAKEVLYG